MGNQDDIVRLRAENARLIALLEASGIEWRASPAPISSPLAPSRLSWESKSTGKSGYAPACANEWQPGVCQKPRIKSADCSNRLLIPLSDTAIYRHLSGEQTLGVYPLLEDDSCFFLAVDFDEADWRDDGQAFVET